MTAQFAIEYSGIFAYAKAAPLVLQWYRELVGHQLLEKVMVGLFAGLVTQLTDHGQALGVVLLFWFCDFALGVLRVFADREREWSATKAAVGILKPFAIGLLWTAAVGMEWAFQVFSALLAGGEGIALEGRFVLLVSVAMVWEEAVSIRKNGTFFFTRIRHAFSLAERVLGRALDPENDDSTTDDSITED